MEREKIKELVLKAARDEFERFGLRRARIEDIARRAGISKGSVYSFFPSKEDIALALMEDFEAREKPVLFRGIMALPPGEWLGAMVSFIDASATLAPMLKIILDPENVEWFKLRVPAEKLAAHMKGDADFLESMVRAAAGPSGIGDEEADLWARALVAAFESYFLGKGEGRARAKALLEIVSIAWKERFGGE